MTTLSQFIARWSGIGVNLPEDNNPYGFQCVELVNEWLKELGEPTAPFTNAQDFDDKLKGNPAFTWTANTPTNIPSPGDVVVWQGLGLPFGHVAIFVSGDVNNFTSFDQNFPLNTLPHLQSHTYWNVEGWLHPKALDPVVDPKDVLIAQLQTQVATLTSVNTALSANNASLLARIIAARTALG
jgi:hypothetical protein